MRRRWRAVCAVLVAGVLTGTTAGTGAAAPAPGARAELYPVPGLTLPVRLLVDKWGVPHIYATSAADAFTAQAFNAARDRLFQMDLWLRKGTGRLAEVLGPEFTEQDQAARLFLYRGDMQREWEAYGPEGRLAATRFAAGVNAYLDWLSAHPERLPEEFRVLGYTPARWTAADVVRIRAHGLSRNLDSEVARAAVTCAAGGDVDADQLRVGLEPAHRTSVPAGFNPCALPEDVLRTFDLATGELAFEGGELRRLPGVTAGGSNAWAVAPGRSTTGRPTLAGDPHRSMPSPSLRYIAHLTAPGLSVIGAGEPFAPGISMGHNGTAGFGLTISGLDQEDLYVYQVDPADPGRYRYGDGWEPFRVVREQIPVAGGGPATVELRYTRHGPVIKVDGDTAYAVRATWLEPGMSPYLGSLKHLRAKSFAEFTRSIDEWGTPSLNHVYADARGDIGMAVGGLAPKRVGYDGLLPVPGDGRYEWTGFHSGRDLPRWQNPPQGFVATANEYNLPPDAPAGLGYEWETPSRHQRITEVLAGKPKISPADSRALQNDQLSIPARRLLKLLEPLSTTDPSAAAALAMLRGWDTRVGADSGPAALFEVWLMRHITHYFTHSVLPPAAAGKILTPDQDVVIAGLENPVDWFGPGGEQVRDGLLLASLGTAWQDTTGLLGPDPGAWRWGGLQHTLFQHPMSPAVEPSVAERWNVGPLPRGGSWSTVNVSYFHPGTFEQQAGATFRMVLDVGDWDASRAVNAPGQSGDPGDPHYRDLAERWRTGEYFPLLYTRAAVEANAVKEILLLPTRT